MQLLGQSDKSAKDRRVVLKLSMNTVFFFNSIVTTKKNTKMESKQKIVYRLNKLLYCVPLNLVGLGFFCLVDFLVVA